MLISISRGFRRLDGGTSKQRQKDVRLGEDESFALPTMTAW